MSFQYRGLKAQYDRHIVTEEEVNHQLQTLRQQHPRIAKVTDRAARLGDEIVLDYAGYCDGKQFEGGTAQMQTLILGSGMFIPGFEEQLVDKVPGEEVIVKVTFPEQYHAEHLAGKPAEFHCAIREIRVKTQYDLDDIFAKEVGECDTFEDFRILLGKAMQEYSDERGEMDLKDRLMRQAAATLDLEIKSEDIDQAIEAQMQNLGAQLAQKGLTVEMYCQFMGKKEEELRDEFRAGAENDVRIAAAIDEIVRLEGITAEQEDIDGVCQMICRQNNLTMEQLKENYDDELKEAVVRTVNARKVMDLIRETAVIS